jgi:hypothetical protein
MPSVIDIVLSLVFTICDLSSIDDTIYKDIMDEYKKQNPHLYDGGFNTVIIQIWCYLYGFEYKFGYDNMKEAVSTFVSKNIELLNDKNGYTVLVPESEYGSFHIPCKFDIEFLTYWCMILESFSYFETPPKDLLSSINKPSDKFMIPLTNWFPPEIVTYLETLSHESAFDKTVISKYTTNQTLQYYCNFVINNINHMNCLTIN